MLLQSFQTKHAQENQIKCIIDHCEFEKAFKLSNCTKWSTISDGSTNKSQANYERDAKEN